ncbi:hypothetical protein G7046_g5081 [Stylonectria norvegica]|nr:hypothetical protein G7046_g5081 [Stylonectria norvegica]
MDEFLATVGIQAMRYAIRSGIAVTSSYALGQCSRLLKAVEDKNIFSELKAARKLLDNKIKIISPAIDLIEFKSSRGNIFLESAAPLARSLHQDIVSLGRSIEAAALVEEDLHAANAKFVVAQERRDSLVCIIDNIKGLLERIDREIPLLQLAITASGESLSTSLPSGISPSRLLQASTFLIIGDTQFAQDPCRPVQIGPAFTLSLYMLFLGHASAVDSSKTAQYQVNGNKDVSLHRHMHGEVYGLSEGDRKPMWQEVLHKARVRLCRTRRAHEFDAISGYRLSARSAEGPSRGCASSESERVDEYAYHLEIIEDLDDGRLHDDDKKREPYDDIVSAGIRESIPIHQLSKIFYADTGRILNIGNAEDGDNNPVLLLKRDVHATPSYKSTDPVADYLKDGDADDSDYVDADPFDKIDKTDDVQATIDGQIRRESFAFSWKHEAEERQQDHIDWRFPSHLDPEWMALEVFEEDDGVGLSEDENDSSSTGEEAELKGSAPTEPKAVRDRNSLDSRVVDQIKNLSIRQSMGPSTAPNTPQRAQQPAPRDLAREAAETRDFVARSPFGTITTSLSLMEMLIRLTSLQEFQQASHLSIPDHILTFFLEETSTTGLVGETQWKARSEAKRRMGFDPYTDTPTH